MAATEAPLRLLCFDGGGVRGLVSLYVLQQCLSFVGDPKPCQFFDMIAGTSTGGLIALMLGRLEMSVQECIDHWLVLMQEVFKKRPLISQISGRFLARYDETVLENGIKKIIRDMDYDENEPLRGVKRQGSTCKTFVVAIAQTTRRPTHFTDWKRIGETGQMMDRVTILEAARATSASTSFFKPATITSSQPPVNYVDGGMGNNNPVNRLWSEAEEAFGAPISSRVRCLVSIGTGLPRLQQYGAGVREILASIAAIATETEDTHQTFFTAHSDLVDRQVYWRFNPPDICDEVSLAEGDQGELLFTRTEAYGSNPYTRRDYRDFARAAQLTEVIVPLTYASTGDTYLFHQLGWGSDHFIPGPKYWEHLTFQAYKIYERIYAACKDNDGLVHFNDFLGQFRLNQANTYPTEQQVSQVWSRLLRDRSESTGARPYDKGFVLAILYMLHVEMVSSGERPRDEKRNVGVHSTRRELMKRWPNWIQCACEGDCGLTWNFANDVGLRDPPGPLKRPCRVAQCIGAASGSRLAKFFSNAERNRAAYDATVSKWRRSEMRA